LETVKRIRTMRGMNQVDLAKASGVSQNTISEIETGRREARPATLGKLAKGLGVDIADFFGEQPYLPKARRPLSAERALTLADADDFRRAVEGAPTEELQQTALALASLTKKQTRENPSSREEAQQRTAANERIAVINGALSRRGAPSPVELVARRFDDAMIPPEEMQEGQQTA
jgi:transcriptional regulator with XRE-family HTH domain